jgi:tRNA(fMet)-specific endonuclease VapC
MIVHYLLDTNTVSYIVRGRSGIARAKLAGLGDAGIACISAITEAEIRYGLAKTPNANVLRAAMEMFLSRIRVLSWGRDEARAYGELRAKLEAAGKNLGNLDMLIAAQAIAVGAVLVSNDKSFLQVDDLRDMENWAEDL